MGTYLSAPVTEKESSDGKCRSYTYGVSSMQGWRVTQEDAHNCIPEFDQDTSLFAVYDGHGGAEVAKYCAENLPDFIKTIDLYKEGKLDDALKESFLGFDEILKRDEVIQELKVLAGVDDDEEEDPEFMQTSETDMLVEEANMPIEELMAKYNSTGPPVPQIKKLQKEKHQSPMIKAKKESNSDNSNNGDTNNSNIESQDPLRLRLDEKLENGQPDNDNNINVEKEMREAEESVKSNLNNNKAEVDSSVQDSEVEMKPAIDTKEASEADSTSSVKPDNSKTAVAGSSTAEAVKSEQVVSSTSSEGSTSSSSVVASESSSSTGVASSSSSSSAGSSGTSSECVAGGSGVSGPSSSTSGSSSAGGSGLSSASSSSSSTAGPSGSGMAGPSGSGVQAGGSGVSSSKKKTIMEEDFDSDDSSDDGEEEEEYDSEELEDEDDDEEEDEDEELGPGGIFGSRAVAGQEDDHTEEPGSDSGCTAVLALIRNNQLVVANAGDSRCVLCRGGQAIDLSVDHKPEDEPERSRIEAAGGKVTNDGRVNGGLNLSRAIGDHFYKRNTEKEAKDQMISALPDIDTAALGEEDEFIVIACDGIWNFMTSQEVVDFVRVRLKNEQKRVKPSIICEELFDNCLAPNTMGDGTGCDNMTCIIVTLPPAENLTTVQTSAKRSADELDTSGSDEKAPEKRVKVDEGEADSTGS